MYSKVKKIYYICVRLNTYVILKTKFISYTIIGSDDMFEPMLDSIIVGETIAEIRKKVKTADLKQKKDIFASSSQSKMGSIIWMSKKGTIFFERSNAMFHARISTSYQNFPFREQTS